MLPKCFPLVKILESLALFNQCELPILKPIVTGSAKLRVIRTPVTYVPRAFCALVRHVSRASRSLESHVSRVLSVLLHHVSRVLYTPGLTYLVPYILPFLTSLVP